MSHKKVGWIGITLGLALLTPALAASKDPDLLKNYLTIQEALAADTVAGVSAAAAAIVKLAGKSEQNKDLAANAKPLTQTKDLATTREAFKALSAAMAQWTSRTHPEGVETVFCSMAPGKWVQKKGEVRNPYYGKSMLTCGEKEK